MTPTELCNVALGHIGQARIADIGERSPGAEHCRRMFDHVRRLCLRDHDWNFAVRRAALTALDSPPPFGFSAAYQLPADCLRVLAINGQPAGVRGTQWEVEGRTVLINADVAHLRYIADADDVTQWDSIFASYFGYRLAAAVAPSFRIDPQAGLQLEQMAAAVRASAQEADNVETAPRVTRLDQSEIIQERGGRWPSGTAGTGTGNTGSSSIGWSRIAVSGQSTVAATLAGDTFTLAQGANITITTDPVTKTVTIAATGGGSGTVNLTPSRTANAVTITPSGGGTAAEIPQANSSNAGVMTADHHNKLNALPTASELATALDGKASATHTHSLNFTGDVTGSGNTGADIPLTIGDGKVTTAKISDLAVTSAKIAAGAVGPTQLASTTVTAGTYANPSSLTVDADGRITSIAAGSPGTKTLFKFFPREAEFPTSAFATLDARGQTPHPVLNFDDNTVETVVFRDYINEGVTFADTGTAVAVFCDYLALSATTGVLGLNISWERLAPGGQDLDSDGFGTAQAGSVTVDATSGKMHRVQVNFTKAQLPSGFAAGDMFRLRIQRNTSVGSDHTADAQFVGCFANFTPADPA
jgi:hypothetical protein